MWTSALKLEAVCSFKPLVFSFNSTLWCNPEDQNQHLCNENLKFYGIQYNESEMCCEIIERF
jgi:hypothetical protein